MAAKGGHRGGIWCVWVINDSLLNDDDPYSTSCGKDFQLTAGTLKENDMKYCPYCGKLIKEKKER